MLFVKVYRRVSGIYVNALAHNTTIILWYFLKCICEMRVQLERHPTQTYETTP